LEVVAVPPREKRKRRQTKDRVLQARIPQQLDTELRDRAEQLGMSVSTVVRNVLLNTFDLVEGVVADSAQVARAAQGRMDVAAGPDENEIVAWQEGVLNRNGLCERCNAILPLGEKAAVGLPLSSRPVFLCLECLACLPEGASDEGGADGDTGR
jgi:hypothetical protein